MNIGEREYDIDITLCLDALEGMQLSAYFLAKKVPEFRNMVNEVLASRSQKLGKLRVSVVLFRNFCFEDQALLVSPFIELPDHAEDFEALMNSMRNYYGGIKMRDGLEGLYCAMRSDWCGKRGINGRKHVIVVVSGGPTNPIGYSKDCHYYPKSMPKDFDELTAAWGNRINPGIMDQRAKRLIMFAPDEHYWSDIGETWDFTVHVKTKPYKSFTKEAKLAEYEEYLDIFKDLLRTFVMS